MHISLNTRIDKICEPLSMPEPISFDFDEMIKAKAEADAEIAAEIERRLTEKFFSIGKRYEVVSYPKPATEKGVPTDEILSGYVYDYNLVAELTALKRKKYRK